ncbi:MAG: class I SAM-dependent methyltransferase [Blastocatellia bacterium]|nr:class I SAM-dependent methyltransferase [Blastocatellia bacterium]
MSVTQFELVSSTATPSQTDIFAGKVLQILNHGALSLMISIGHRTHLFDTMALMPPAGSLEIAVRAKLDQRYVREWLNAMVTGGIVEYDPATQTYTLPPEHAALLTRSAAPNNLAVAAQFIPVLANVEDQILDCFRHGGGVPYSEYPRFHEVMAEESLQTVVAGLFDHILPLVPDLPARLQAGISVLDVGCGRGRALIRMAQAFPNSLFTGYDFSLEATDSAQGTVEQLGLTNIRFEVRDVTHFDEVERFDLITAFDAIHDQAEPARVLANIRQALHPQGTFLMQDIAGSSHVHHNLEHPMGSFLYTISCMHCMTVSLASNGAGLGAMWGQEMAQNMLHNAGFADVSVHQLPHDAMNVYYLARK